MLSMLLLIPLGVTSTRNARRRLGAAWQRLHRLVYVSAILACVHFFWLSKDWQTPTLYAGILGGLFLWRIIISLRTTKR
jgi:sulfoxide reductase heme-binding subunit YedZ